MSVTIVATAGAATANSYVTKAEADTYWAGFTNSAYILETSADNKSLALIAATRSMDRLKFIGKKLSDLPEGNSGYQVLEWPRIAPGYDGFYMGDGEDRILPYTYNDSGVLIIPEIIRKACCEQANFLLETGEALGASTERIRLQREGVRSFAVPGLSEQYSGNPSGLYTLAPSVSSMLSKYIINSSRAYRG
jgi:hypothetical protein